MKALFFTVFVVVLSSCGNSANNPNSKNSPSSPSNETNVSGAETKGELPAAASNFLTTYFNALQIKNVIHKKSPVADGTFFEVELSDLTEIDFDKNGNWVEINGDDNTKLPIDMLPSAVQGYLNAHYTGIGLTSIEKTDQGYELELNNGIEVYFDLSGNFLRESK
ncbi:PepSY-like domain-containing protein [Sphingobacterium pedocola]|uniref:Putative beta-lactamase-inhibitor-like PepSY-like domain-containing protein n=1 Tax=Sphingobacterium pedocola TaxID=2082722 RepID=A0ABR9TD50_9SPHI|nr:PepSY-like domain-containing protein [Sphingobacterium pedocola]MBE8723190.1 hypothetical protein [Sphingobacterium pedocola]